MRIFFLVFFLLMGVIFYWGSVHVKKKPYYLIQRSMKLSRMILSPEVVKLYADKIAKMYRLAGIFFIVFAFVSLFVRGCVLSSVVICISVTFISVYQLYHSKMFTGKAPIVPIILLSLLMVAIFTPIGYAYVESSVIVDNETIRISGIYGAKIPLNQLNEVFLADTLPKISIRTNGIGAGTISKGHFHSKSLKRNVKLILHSKTRPFIYIRHADNKYVIINFKKKEKTLQIYDRLKVLTGNEKRTLH